MKPKPHRNIKLTVEYEGTDYFGWQTQKGKKTIQSEVIKAIKKVTGERVMVHGASRTDSGVHAIGQTANFKTATTIPINKIPHALNAYLPKDITIKSAEEVSDTFNAQFDATNKTYRYTILNRETPCATGRQYFHLVTGKLDIVKMKAAAGFLIGEKDYRAFASEASKKENTVRRIGFIDIQKAGDLIYFNINGSGFLYNMVRTIMGTLILVGLGMLSPEGVKQILDSKDRKKAGKNLPARGLCLMEVKYEKG